MVTEESCIFKIDLYNSHTFIDHYSGSSQVEWRFSGDSCICWLLCFSNVSGPGGSKGYRVRNFWVIFEEIIPIVSNSRCLWIVGSMKDPTNTLPINSLLILVGIIRKWALTTNIYMGEQGSLNSSCSLFY